VPVITISAGIFQLNFLISCIASAASRSARFFLVAGLMGLIGPRIKPFIDKYFDLLCIASTILLVGGFAAIKYIG
jgi:membrane protein DedA with SNARE-associated domain